MKAKIGTIEVEGTVQEIMELLQQERKYELPDYRKECKDVVLEQVRVPIKKSASKVVVKTPTIALHRASRGGHRGKQWSSADDAFLLQHKASWSMSALKKQLGRTKSAIKQRYNMLLRQGAVPAPSNKVVKQERRARRTLVLATNALHPWTPTDDQLLLRRRDLPITDLARLFGRSRKAIKERLSKLEFWKKNGVRIPYGKARRWEEQQRVQKQANDVSEQHEQDTDTTLGRGEHTQWSPEEVALLRAVCDDPSKRTKLASRLSADAVEELARQVHRSVTAIRKASRQFLPKELSPRQKHAQRLQQTTQISVPAIVEDIRREAEERVAHQAAPVTTAFPRVLEVPAAYQVLLEAMVRQMVHRRGRLTFTNDGFALGIESEAAWHNFVVSITQVAPIIAKSLGVPNEFKTIRNGQSLWFAYGDQ